MLPVIPSQSVFSPVLYNSTPVTLSEEQLNWIREVLEITSSDSQFADKAFRAIKFILTTESVIAPVLSSLSPSSAVLGTASFTLHVVGENFTPESVIIWNGSTEPTTFVSATELTTEVDMTTAVVAAEIPVEVLSIDGVMSNVMTFTLTEVLALTAKKTSPTPQSKDFGSSSLANSPIHKK